MANQEVYVARITSNTDKLSSLVIHDTFSNLVRKEMEGAETFLKALVPKRTGDLFAHVGSKGPFDDGFEIEASVGIPKIKKDGESDPFSQYYPIFVDQGTGPFGPKTKEAMYIPPSRGYPGFLYESKGQRGQHFAAAAFALTAAMLEINGEKFKAELTSRLQAAKID